MIKYRKKIITFAVSASVCLGIVFWVLAGASALLGGQSEDPKPVHKLTVVIDAGHGGRDPGAVGPGGVFEKDIALGISLRLKEKIEQAGLAVVLTRDKDIFVPLAERAQIANRVNADAFISVHANASRRGAWGFETYFLSISATDEEARKMALIENGAATFENNGGSDLPPDVNSDLGAILFDMAQAEYIRESEKLAVTIQGRLDEILDTHNRGVKQAPFMVLTNAAMPAVLVEIGFVSSKKEVKLLAEPEMQDKIAEALNASVSKFANERAQRMGLNENSQASGAGGI